MLLPAVVTVLVVLVSVSHVNGASIALNSSCRGPKSTGREFLLSYGGEVTVTPMGEGAGYVDVT